MTETDEKPPQEPTNEAEVLPPPKKKINPNSFVPVLEEMKEVFGEDFVDNKNEKVKPDEDVFDCTVLGVLFSAGWGSPCRIFNKDLISIYEQMNEGRKRLEIIQISFDKDEDEFKKAIAGLPWKFLPLNSDKINSLKEKFGVLTIPKFFPVDKQLKILSNTGREDLLEYGVDICDKWNEDARVCEDIEEEEEVANHEGEEMEVDEAPAPEEKELEE